MCHVILTTPFSSFSSNSWDLMQSTGVENLTFLALTVPEILLGTTKVFPVLWPCFGLYSDHFQYDPKKDLACMWDKNNWSVICTLFKITFLWKSDECGERPFFWPLVSFPDRHTYSMHSARYCLVAGHSSRTSVFGGQTFPVLRSICIWRVTTYEYDKLYLPHMVVTIYKYTVENNLTEKREKTKKKSTLLLCG